MMKAETLILNLKRLLPGISIDETEKIIYLDYDRAAPDPAKKLQLHFGYKIQTRIPCETINQLEIPFIN